MRLVILVLLLSSAVAHARTPPKGEAALDQKTEAARASDAAAAAKKAADADRVSTVRWAGNLQLEPTPLLRWSNPVLGSFHGSVFVWTDEGRPAVVASIFKKYDPPPSTLEIEFHSLIEGLVIAERDGHSEWSPVRGGIEFRPISGAPAPADTPARRLRQLRSLAAEFSVIKTGRNAVTRPLRLLTQPVYRHEDQDLGGALFAFVEGTDPEVFLLIEARAQEMTKAWHYALARMNSVEFRAAHREREVRSVRILPWAQARDPRQRYALIRVTTDSGPNPPDALPKRDERR